MPEQQQVADAPSDGGATDDSGSDNGNSTEDEDFTTKTSVRLRWLASALALIIIGVFLALVSATALGAASISMIPQQALHILFVLVLSAAGWTFGLDLLDRYFGGKK